MDWKSTLWFGWNLAFLAGDVWAITSWITGGSMLQDLSTLPFGPPEYAAVIAICTGALFALNWYAFRWVYHSIHPASKLRALEPLVLDLVRSSETWPRQGYVPQTGEDAARLTELVKRLRELNINHPSEHEDWEWAKFLPSLLIFVKRGEIKEAKNLWPLG